MVPPGFVSTADTATTLSLSPFWPLLIHSTMSEEDTRKMIKPSLPPNYVSILQLQQQWLTKKHKQEQEAKLKQIQTQTQTQQNQQKQIIDAQERIHKEKEPMVQELAAEKPIRDTQQHQSRQNYVKSSGSMEKFSLGRFQGSNTVGKSYQGSFKGSGHVAKTKQGFVNVKESNLGRLQGSDYVEKSNLGRFQGFDQSGYVQRRDYNRNYGKGGFKDKGKGKIGEVREKGVDSVLHQVEERGDFERCEGKCRQSGRYGGGGVEVVMCLHVVALEEDEHVGVKKPDDGFKSGLRSNVGDLCANDDASEGLVREKKADDGTMRVGYKKNGLFRPSRVNKVALSADFGDSGNLGSSEGVEETEEVIEGKENARISDMGVAVEVGNVEHKSRWGYKKNRNKKGLSRSEVGRDTEQGHENGRDVREENGIQMDLEKGNNGKTGEGSGDNIGDGEADMGVTIEVMNVEQKSRGGSKKNRNKKGLSRSEFGRGTEQEQENERGMGEENIIQLVLKKENGGNIGEEKSGDITGDGEGEAEKGPRLKQWKQWKHRRVSVGRRNIDERMMDNTRCGYQKWAVKGDSARENIIKNTIGEKSRTYVSVEIIPVVVTENEKTNLCSDGSQRNNCDNTLNFGVQGNKTEKKENQKEELFGEHEDKSLLISNEANGERAKFRDKTGGNGYEGFSRENTRRDFKELSLNSQRVGNGRKNFQMPGQRRRSKIISQVGDNQSNTLLVWMKKGETADADIPES